jgi:2-polyprenyl-6-methoxyphenol hydroxylase-like FAD-dependent oxidoreductase
MQVPVLIAGAGPTGLALALWLRRLEVPLRIVDRNPAPARESRALVVHARTLELYAQVGFAADAIANGIEFTAVNLWARGRKVARAALGAIGAELSPYPYMLILAQDRHERLLADKLAALGVQVERETELTGFEQDDARVLARLRKPDGSEERCECAWLAGCDGARSAVRHGMDLDFPGATYRRLFYVADIEARGTAVNGELNVALDEADLLAVFPLPGEGNARLIGTIREASEGAGEHLGWDDVSRGIIGRLGLEVEKVHWFSTYRVHHRVTNRFRSGRAFVLGDAAHIHSPVGGQGMNTGIGDAVNLAWKLAMVVRGQAHPSILDTFESERIAFARRLVATTDRAFTFVSSDGPIARFVRLQVVPRVLPEVMSFEAARRYVFRTVSQTLIRYPRSALSAGRAGSVAGGDRLPWTGDNFAPLASLEWQVHVYGSATRALLDACHRLGMPVQVFAWDQRAQRAGLARDALYLVRPDGYVALADAAADPARLEAYARRHFT